MILRFASLLPLVSLVAVAHEGESIEPHDLWKAWSFEPGVVIPLAVAAILYSLGARRSRGIRPLQMASFWAAWMILALALVSPVHPLGEVLFSAHMVQHEILMLMVAPLFVISRPLVAFLWALPLGTRRFIGAWSKRGFVRWLWHLLTRPLTAWWIHAAALWLWHAPALFQATLTSERVHALQHVSFLGSALLFWWSLLSASSVEKYGSGFLYIFSSAVHTSVLGALLTLSPRVWYPAYAARVHAWGMTPLQDQQIGGLIMWVPAGLVYLAAGLYMFAKWIRHSDTTRSQVLSQVSGVLLIIVTTIGLSSCSSAPASPRIVSEHGDTAPGAAAIVKYGCGSCHTIPGINAARGLVGPPLTGVGSRVYIAGLLLTNTDNLVRWISNPQGINEHTVMPNLGVTPQDALNISAYLLSLK